MVSRKSSFIRLAMLATLASSCASPADAPSARAPQAAVAARASAVRAHVTPASTDARAALTREARAERLAADDAALRALVSAHAEAAPPVGASADVAPRPFAAALETRHGDLVSALSGTLDSGALAGALARVTLGGRQVAVGLTSLGAEDASGAALARLAPVARAADTDSREGVSFAEVFPGARFELRPSFDRLEAALVLESAPLLARAAGEAGMLSLETSLVLPDGFGLWRHDGDDWRFEAPAVDRVSFETAHDLGLGVAAATLDDAEVAMHVPAPVARDAAGALAPVRARVRAAGDGSAVQYATLVPAEWLLDAARVYPVVIDPPIVAGPPAAPTTTVRAKLDRAGRLVVTGTAGADFIVLRLSEKEPRALEIDDVNVPAAAEFSFPLVDVARITVRGGDGDDRIVIDDSRGEFLTGRRALVSGGAGNDELVGTTGAGGVKAALTALELLRAAGKVAGAATSFALESQRVLTGETLALARTLPDDFATPAQRHIEEAEAFIRAAEELMERSDVEVLGAFKAFADEAFEELGAEAEAVRDAQADELQPAANALVKRAAAIARRGQELLSRDGARLQGRYTTEFEKRLDALLDATDDVAASADPATTRAAGSSNADETAEARVDAAVDAFERRLDTFYETVGREVDIPGLLIEADAQRTVVAAAAALAAQAESRIVAAGDALVRRAELELNPAASAFAADAERRFADGTEAVGNAVESELDGNGEVLAARMAHLERTAEELGKRAMALSADAESLALRVEDLLGAKGTGGVTVKVAPEEDTCDPQPVATFAGDDDDNVVIGTSADDTLTGGAGTDLLLGFGGDDDMSGGAGMDFLLGFGGRDRMHGNEDMDFLLGMADGDCLFGDEDIDFVLGNDGDDYMEGNDDYDAMFGLAGDDGMYGNDAIDFMMGNDGEDDMHGGGGTTLGEAATFEIELGDVMLGNLGPDTMHGDDSIDFMFGGPDTDTMHGDKQLDLMMGGTENDTMFGEGGGGITVDSIPLFFIGNFMFGGTENDDMTGGAVMDFMWGNPGTDMMRGGLLNDFMFGGPDNDTMRGEWFGDWMFGQGGADDMRGSQGNDWMFGGDDNDLMRGELGNDVMSGDADNDDMEGGLLFDIMVGGAGNDHMLGNAQWDMMFGGLDADDMDGGWGNDFMEGGSGNDVMKGNLGWDIMFGDKGDDLMDGEFGFDVMFGGRGRDVMNGGGLNDFMSGDKGSDIMHGNGGWDFMMGGQQPDQMWGDNGFDMMFGMKCDDEMYGGNGFDLMWGNEDEDRMWGEDGADIMSGDHEDDWMSGGSGPDFMLGGKGKDLMYGDSWPDAMFGGKDDDLMYGLDGADIVDGNSGADTLYGGTGADLVIGGKGNDLMRGEDGADMMLGGKGNDWLIGAAGVDFQFGGKGDDAIYGDANADFIWGNGGNDDIHCGDGGDFAFGGSGDDRMYGEINGDFLRGGKGHDKMWGGHGEDWMSGAKGDDRMCGGDHRDKLRGKGGNDRMSGGAEKDVLRGNRDNDVIYGDDGNDVLRGRAGDDDLDGAAGDDKLFGNRHQDRLRGGSGDDKLRGGRHDDQLWGEADADKLKGNAGTDGCDDGPGGTSVASCEGAPPALPTFAPLNMAEIRGLKFDDLNGNGVRDANEPGLAGVTIYLDLNNNGVLDTGEPSDLSMFDQPDTALDETGMYDFFDLGAGSYVLRELVPAGYVPTTPSGGAIALTLGPCDAVTVDFGNREACHPTADGKQCVSDGCVDSTSKCLPRCVMVGENGQAVGIADCECGGAGACHVEFGSAGPFCSGQACGDGSSCQQTVTQLPGGRRIICCDCGEGPGCQPSADLQSCDQALACTDAAGVCAPECVNWDAEESALVVTDCGCAGAGSCSVDTGAPGGPACGGACPPDYTCISRTEEGCKGEGDDICCGCGSIACEPEPDRKSCKEHVCPDPEQTCIPTVIAVNWFCDGGPTPGAPCGTQPDCLGGVCTPEYEVVTCTCMDPEECHVDFQETTGAYCTGDCPLDSDDCKLNVNGNEYSCGCGPGGCDVKDDLTACEAVVCDDPTQSCEPTEIALVLLCAGGATPGISCATDSDCSGGTCETTPLVLDCECTSACHVEYDPATGPYCEGSCPPGEVCQLEEEDGSWSCDCVEPECEPNDEGTACGPAPCDDPNAQCLPVEVAVIQTCQGGTFDGLLCTTNAECPGGVCADEYSIEECECGSPNGCHIQLDAAPLPKNSTQGATGASCTGGCPDPDFACDLIDDDDVLYCECQEPPPPTCAALPDGSGCTQTPCTDPASKCTPTLITVDDECVGGPNAGQPCVTANDCPGGTCEKVANVQKCDCLGGGACHIQQVPGSPDPVCTGSACVAPQLCRHHLVGNQHSCGCE